MTPEPATRWHRVWPGLVVALAALGGMAAVVDEAGRLSATYDEVTYLKIGARWWRTGAQAEITRLGSPLLFWKLQQAPTLWLIDHWGDRAWIDDPMVHQARLLPWIRIGAAWIWLVTLGLVAAWARSLYGPRAMAFAAALFALSPNLLAHGALATMELPIVATSTALLMVFGRFLRTGSRWAFWGSAVMAGLAFSCKFTAVVFPPILAALWAIDGWMQRDRALGSLRSVGRTIGTVGVGMIGFVVVMLAANVVWTGFAVLPISARSGPHPVLDRHLPPVVARSVGAFIERAFPVDWVGFLTQVIYQRQGGPSYLLGERRLTGWWYYYPVTLAVKVPLACGFLVLARCWYRRSVAGAAPSDRRDWIIPVTVVLFLLAAMAGSKRNYGIRYLLPLAPAAIVYLSALANLTGQRRWIGRVGLLGMAVAVAAIHPYELSYFNLIAGGPVGGRRILADSNLDWGQGAVALAALQAEHREYRDLTWYYFGDTNPRHYGVVGRVERFDAHKGPAGLAPTIVTDTTFVAVSASLQWGPWGPAGYFRILNSLTPVRYTADDSVAIYRTLDIIAAYEAIRVSKGRGPG